MPIQWIKRRIRLAAVKAGKEDLETFISILSGQSDEEIAETLLFATQFRLNIERQMYITKEAFGFTNFRLGEDEQADVLLALNRILKQLQQKQAHVTAGGAALWLHCARAVFYPELRVLVNSMWQNHLKRGHDLLEDVYAKRQTELISRP